MDIYIYIYISIISNKWLTRNIAESNILFLVSVKICYPYTRVWIQNETQENIIHPEVTNSKMNSMFVITLK